MERIKPITPEEYTRRTGKPYNFLAKFNTPIIEPVKWYDKPLFFTVTAMEIIECASLTLFVWGTIALMQVVI